MTQLLRLYVDGEIGVSAQIVVDPTAQWQDIADWINSAISGRLSYRSRISGKRESPFGLRVELVPLPDTWAEYMRTKPLPTISGKNASNREA